MIRRRWRRPCAWRLRQGGWGIGRGGCREARSRFHRVRWRGSWALRLREARFVRETKPVGGPTPVGPPLRGRPLRGEIAPVGRPLRGEITPVGGITPVGRPLRGEITPVGGESLPWGGHFVGRSLPWGESLRGETTPWGRPLRGGDHFVGRSLSWGRPLRG